ISSRATMRSSTAGMVALPIRLPRARQLRTSRTFRRKAEACRTVRRLSPTCGAHRHAAVGRPPDLVGGPGEGVVREGLPALLAAGVVAAAGELGVVRDRVRLEIELVVRLVHRG